MQKPPSKETLTASPHKVVQKAQSRETVTRSPHKNPPQLPSSGTASLQGSPHRLRKLQSAHQLSSNYSALNGPSLISQQRQQQQRNTSTTIPPLPELPSPQKQNRPRANSDAPSPYADPSQKRNAIPRKKKEDPKTELKTLIRRNPKGDVLGSLDDLRHLILVDGLEADTDGMVRPVDWTPQGLYSLLISHCVV